MKAVTVASQGADLKISDVAVPEPSDGEILIKSIYAPVNPMSGSRHVKNVKRLMMIRDGLMVNTGLLVQSWPFIPGVDAGGVVVKAGKDAISALGTPFKEGDQVFGCTRLGNFGYSTFEEYVRMSIRLNDDLLTAKVSDGRKPCSSSAKNYDSSRGILSRCCSLCESMNIMSSIC
jgi:NADPH:quinone reductase-like Zn-dependent oxidoreductase